MKNLLIKLKKGKYMKYMGSKNRIAKEILPIILKGRKSEQTFYDICCGGANLIDKVMFGKRIAVDNNEYLIEALKLIRDNVNILPKNKNETNELIYKNMKLSNNKALKGYYGFALSYGGKWFGGWRRDKENKRDYVAEAYRNALKQSVKLQGIEFLCANYYNILFDSNSIIYIDPPYKNTTQYKNIFNHEKFWNWCRQQSRNGHIVFISEYTAPSDFKCLWEKFIISSLTKNTGSKFGKECLFTI